MKIGLLLISLLLVFTAQGQIRSENFKNINWSLEMMDHRYDPSSPTATGKIISKYKPAIDRLLEPIGISAKEMDKGYPEGELSNWATDALKTFANDYIKENRIKGKCDFSLLNFGGIRATMPQGDVNRYDILSIFPFDNYAVILFLEGKYVKELMENFAKRNRIEPMGGVEIEIGDGKLKKCLINGKPIDEKRIYRVASIDFLLQGGDSVYALRYASKKIDTGVLLRDAFIEQIQKGRVIDAKKDGRAKIWD